MSNGCKSIKKFLKGFDQFGAQMNFRIGNDSHYRTVFGGVTFALYSIALIIFVYISCKSFILKENMTLIYTNKVINPAPPMNLVDLKFGFAFGLTYGNDSQSYIEFLSNYIELSARLVKRDGYADAVKQKLDIPLKWCERSDFYYSEKGLDEEKFEILDLANMYCPDMAEFNKTMEIKGLYSDKEFYYIELSIQIKEEEEPTFDMEELRKVFNENPFEAVIFFSDTGYEYDNLSNPIKNYINNDHIYVDFDFFKKIDYSFSILEFSTDENVLYSNPYTNQTVVYESRSANSFMIHDRVNTDNEDKHNLLRFYIRGSNKYTIVSRTYQKLTELMANMTGILSQIILLLILIVGYSNEKGAHQKIMHRIMKFRGKKNYNHDIFVDLFNKKEKVAREKLKEYENCRRKALRFPSGINISNIPASFPLFNLEGVKDLNDGKELRDANDIESVRSEDMDSEKRLDITDNNQKKRDNGKYVMKNTSTIGLRDSSRSQDKSNIEMAGISLNHLNLEKTTSKPLQIQSSPNKISESSRSQKVEVNPSASTNNRLEYISMNSFEFLLSTIFCCNRKWKENNFMIEKGEEKVFYYLDVLTYIKKMQEIEILKYLLLTQDQLNLFNFLSSPTISICDHISDVHKIYEEEVKKKIILRKEEIQKLGESYENVVHSEMFTPLDSKMIQLFNSDLEGLRY